MGARIIGGFLVAAILAPAQASADSDCPAGTSAPYRIDLPRRVTYDADVAFSLVDSNGSAPISLTGATATVEPADNEGITHAYDRQPAGQHGWSLRLNVGDGSALVTVTYRDPLYECQRVATAVVAGFSGTAPRLMRHIDPGDADHEASAELVLRLPSDCREAALGSIRVTISSRGTRRSAVLSDQCGSWNRRRARPASGWRLDLVTGKDDESPFARVRLAGGGNARRKFRYRVTHRGASVASGALIGRTRSQPSKQIWQGSDAFVNYCINETKEIRSEGGRLYCWFPGFVIHSWRFVS